jgi:hypothetical protein
VLVTVIALHLQLARKQNKVVNAEAGLGDVRGGESKLLEITN